MKLRLFAPLVASAFVLGLAACEVAQQEEGEMPEVEVEEGELPEYEVERGDVEVERDTVTVPEVEIEEPNNTNR